MAMHNTNSLLKYVVPAVLLVLVIVLVAPLFHSQSDSSSTKTLEPNEIIKNTAAHDSAAESLDTLTAELSATKEKISEVSKNDEQLKRQNDDLLKQVHAQQNEATTQLSNEVQQLKNKIQELTQSKTKEYILNGASDVQTITTVSDLSLSHDQTALKKVENRMTREVTSFPHESNNEDKPKAIPYYTIPANATSVKDRLMTALVGRIPVKGIVTDPYPFKIVISDDNLAANGLRIPHLLQMIVSGYCEGDLLLKSVRGWVTSLTFVFQDGTISTTTSNDNDIGNFTKSNSLGYLSDKYGNPFISGRLITNAPAYLGGNIALGMGVGAASAYAQSQTTTSTSFLGNTNNAVTGSPAKFVAGQAAAGGLTEAEQWWHDRAAQSFDAVYVPPMDSCGEYVEIAVNFAKEIHIDYNPKGRKLNYAHRYHRIHSMLD